MVLRARGASFDMVICRNLVNGSTKVDRLGLGML
jgi:hypothetical protein